MGEVLRAPRPGGESHTGDQADRAQHPQALGAVGMAMGACGAPRRGARAAGHGLVPLIHAAREQDDGDDRDHNTQTESRHDGKSTRLLPALSSWMDRPVFDYADGGASGCEMLTSCVTTDGYLVEVERA